MKRPPHVLFVIHQIGSGADGGIRSITEIIRSIPDVPKTVITNIESPVTDSLRKVAPVEIWPMVEDAYNVGQARVRFRMAQIRARLANSARTWAKARRTGGLVLHANDYRAFWNTAPGAKLAGARLIFNVRDTLREGSRSVGMWRRALGLCDRFLVLSREMAASWRRDLEPASSRPANRDKFSHLYSIVDRTRFHPVGPRERDHLRATLGIDPARPAIVYVGRFDDKKAQRDFIDHALPALKAVRPDAVTYFVGDFEPDRDPYAAGCAAAVDRLGMRDQVRFMGYSPHAADWYRAADIVALASRREGLPRCMIESLGCGAAFVSFDVCSTREILEGHDCGIAVPHGDYRALAGAIADLLGDDARRNAYQRKGPVLVAELFDPAINGARYEALLAEVAGVNR